MKAPSLLILAVSAASLVSCTQTPVVQVIDSKTKQPIPDASVKAVSGEYSSGSNYTNGNGATLEPKFPGGVSELEVKRDGYQTTRVKY